LVVCCAAGWPSRRLPPAPPRTSQAVVDGRQTALPSTLIRADPGSTDCRTHNNNVETSLESAVRSPSPVYIVAPKSGKSISTWQWAVAECTQGDDDRHSIHQSTCPRDTRVQVHRGALTSATPAVPRRASRVPDDSKRTDGRTDGRRKDGRTERRGAGR